MQQEPIWYYAACNCAVLNDTTNEAKTHEELHILAPLSKSLPHVRISDQGSTGQEGRISIDAVPVILNRTKQNNWPAWVDTLSYCLQKIGKGWQLAATPMGIQGLE